MKFQVNINENDYYEFNIFHSLKSPYGEKNIRSSRIIIAVLGVIAALLILVFHGFTKDAVIYIIPLVAVIVILEILWKRIILSGIKETLKQLKKKGKMAYSPYAELEFSENSFTEITEEEKTERKYSSIERISIVENKYIYIHTNNLAAVIMPMNTFTCKEQYDEFVELLKGLNVEINYYT